MAGKQKKYEAEPEDNLCLIIKLPNGYSQNHLIDTTDTARTVSQEVWNLYHFGHHGLPGSEDDMVMVLFFTDDTHSVLLNNDSLSSHRNDLIRAEYLKIMHKQTAAQLPNQSLNVEALGAKAK